MTAKKYLLDIGFDDAHLPELFNNDDKSYYQITELMEEYHQAKLKLLGTTVVSQQRGLLVAYEMSKQKEVSDKYRRRISEQYVDDYLATNSA